MYYYFRQETRTNDAVHALLTRGQIDAMSEVCFEKKKNKNAIAYIHRAWRVFFVTLTKKIYREQLHWKIFGYYHCVMN